MKLVNHILIKSFCGMVLLSGSLFANENVDLVKQVTSETIKEKQLLQAGPRALSDEEHIALKKQRAALDGEECTLDKQEATGQSQESQDQEHPVREEKISHGAYYYYSSHPFAWHVPYLMINDREKVELNDGTIWSVNFWDRWKLKDWLTSDIIFILPNSKLFWDYTLVNQRTGDYVDVNLSELEIFPYDATFSGNRLWIVDIDDLNDVIYLSDGSRWEVSVFDDALIHNWQLGQVVIVGINNGYNSALFPNILINFSKLNYVHAECR